MFFPVIGIIQHTFFWWFERTNIKGGFYRRGSPNRKQMYRPRNDQMTDLPPNGERKVEQTDGIIDIGETDFYPPSYDPYMQQHMAVKNLCGHKTRINILKCFVLFLNTFDHLNTSGMSATSMVPNNRQYTGQAYNVVVRNLPTNFNVDHLIKLYAPFGPIQSVHIEKADQHSGGHHPSPYGIVSYFFLEDAKKVNATNYLLLFIHVPLSFCQFYNTIPHETNNRPLKEHMKKMKTAVFCTFRGNNIISEKKPIKFFPFFCCCFFANNCMTFFLTLYCLCCVFYGFQQQKKKQGEKNIFSKFVDYEKKKGKHNQSWCDGTMQHPDFVFYFFLVPFLFFLVLFFPFFNKFILLVHNGHLFGFFVFSAEIFYSSHSQLFFIYKHIGTRFGCAGFNLLQLSVLFLSLKIDTTTKQSSDYINEIF
ncbi:hypothetical protein RFI_15479 [Reticulomyxa filosa]|uniref:RRM domain-containing protein n=1 Tax=Reticulomyxa filosa TaxID=46433 RepID=X6N606_RETFI|nr:hypothetical protein RFI_15479 [Reticulomyxa filosa]|eukprot:ETO21725.1 hypothetical protein RFI_15479 [Reticulomyxa filosa]